MSAAVQTTAAAYVSAAFGFSLLFCGVSLFVNWRLSEGRLRLVAGEAALLAVLVFLLAVLCEAGVNPLYEALFGHKLWEYRLLPLHDRNVSALGAIVWTSYGLHLYFLDQTLDRRIAAGPWRDLVKAAFIGVEAPLVWEVLGNTYFLLTVGEYYAYYLPGDVFHLTSLQVVPVYAVCVYAGLQVHARVRRHHHCWSLPLAGAGAGLIFLMTG